MGGEIAVAGVVEQARAVHAPRTGGRQSRALEVAGTSGPARSSLVL